MKKSTIALLLSGLCCLVSCNNQDNYTVLKDYIVSTPTYFSLDYEYAEDYFESLSDREFGGCSAVVKNIGTEANKRLIVGRNMDLSYSNKSAHIVRTKEDGKHETIGVAYSTRDVFPDFDAFKKEMKLDNEASKLLPFFREDVINDSGLYCEVNMRNDEYFDDGSEKFGCDGTNKMSNINVHMLALPTYICSNCANVSEMLEYISTLNIYSNKNYWNFAYIIADAEGNYGLLEIAQNKIFWLSEQNLQTNFYVEESLNKICVKKTGLGRYAYLQDHLDEITDIDSMQKVMYDVRYTNVYLGSECPFDMRSEAYGLVDVPSFDYLVDEANKDEVYSKIDPVAAQLRSLTREERIQTPIAWQTIFSTVADSNNKTIHVQFYEDTNLRFDFSI